MSSRAQKTNFDYSFLMGTDAKPRPEKHHLLSRIQKDDEVEGTFRELDTARSNLMKRMEDLRAGDHNARPGSGPLAATTPRGGAPGDQQRARLLSGEEEPQRLPHTASSAYAAMHGHTPAHHATAGPNTEDRRERQEANLTELMKLMDPEGVGSIPSGVLAPLLLWLGLAQHQSAALATLRLAFGEAEAVPVAAMLELVRFAEVEIRLAEGLRKLARAESVMPLCEFLTECDGWRLRSWFRSLRHDLDGRVDVAEMQRWLAQTEIITDRQALFRFLCQVTHGEVVVNQCSGFNACKAWALHPGSRRVTVETGGGGAERFGEVKHRGGFSLEDFASMLCRCAIAWCLDRTMQLLESDPAKHPLEQAAEEEDDLREARKVTMATWDCGSSLAMRWTQLQRRLAVSLLINSGFWGNESRAVLGSMKPTEALHGGDDLTTEQWNILFQRARAQGLASTLPTAEEVADAKVQRFSRRASFRPIGFHRARAA